MKNEVLVSAVITTHNRPRLLVRAVKSVFEQTYSNIELIVVDDASDERSDELFEDYKLQYIYISKAESKGGNHARNIGILAAKGEYVAFLDDDDYWLPNKIQEQVDLIEEKKCGLVYCPRTLEVVDRDGIRYYNEFANPSYSGDLSKKILYTFCSFSSCIIVNRSLLNTVGNFNEKLRFWQDYELTIRLAQRTPFFYVSKNLVVYRIDKDDVNRLTNKFFEWKDTVKQIHSIHRGLYNNLNFKEKLLVKRLVWGDAIVRSSNANLKAYIRYYVFLRRFLDLILKMCK